MLTVDDINLGEKKEKETNLKVIKEGKAYSSSSTSTLWFII